MMKAVILAGGLGTRISEETSTKPKPMVEIGGRPILWHIMNIYARQGIKDFIICLGYKGYVIKKYFLDYPLLSSDFSINLKSGKLSSLSRSSADWNVTLVDTGVDSMTGGRIKRVIEQLNLSESFHLTYGDGLANIDIKKLQDAHKKSGKLCTVTAVTPPGRFGVLDVTEDNTVVGFREKVDSNYYRINGGFFVVEPQISEYIAGDQTVWEKKPMETIAIDGQMNAYIHNGFWQPVDTLRDKMLLEQLWDSGDAPWTR